MEHDTSTSESTPGQTQASRTRKRGRREWLDDLDNMLRTSKDEDIETLKTRLREQLQDARAATQGAAGAAAGAAGGYIREAAGSADDYVRTWPWHVLACAALGAFLAGVCVRRR